MCQRGEFDGPSASPFGVAHFKILPNSLGEAEDCVFLDVNSTFEELTGLCRSDVVGRRGNRILSELAVDIAQWNSFYAGVLRTGRTQEMTRWVTSLGRYLTVTATPVIQGCFMVVLTPVEEENYCALHAGDAAQALEPLDALFHNKYDAVSLLEYDRGEYRYVRNNAVHQELTGYSDIAGRRLVDVVGEETGEILRGYYEQCMRTGRPVKYEQEFHFTPGTRVWKTEVTPVLSNGGIHYLLCFSQDITELKRVRQENETLNSRLQAMFNQHSAVKMFFEADTGRIVDVNPAACAQYGYTREEFLRLHIQDINVTTVDLVKEDRLSQEPGGVYIPALSQRMKSGEIRQMDVYSCPIWVGERKYRYSIVVDVTEREAFRSALMQEKELLETTLQSIGDGVVTTDNAGRVTSLNKVAVELTGWDSVEAAGKSFEDVFLLQNEETGVTVDSPIRRVLETGVVVGLANHTVLIDRQGERVPIADSAAPIKTKDGKSHGVVMVFRDVSAEKAYSEQIEFLSSHDPLTGLYNRRGLEQALQSMDTAEQLPIAVIMGDVNGLKITNDVFGHRAGDTLLQNAAQLLREHCGSIGLVARWGGDEFVAALPKTDMKMAEELINQMRNTQISIAGKELSMSLSLGCGLKSEPGQDIQNAMRVAEESMYHQKLLDGKSYRNAVINALLATLRREDDGGEVHAKRLEEYCHTVGRLLGLSPKEMDELSLLTLLHDIGKASIPSDLLQRENELSPEERKELRRHPEIGYRIAQATPELTGVAELILAHHERWDGTGYPQGLKGEAIPRACRILALAKAFDDMRTGRGGQQAVGVETALGALRRGAGTRFDPQITALFVKAMKSGE